MLLVTVMKKNDQASVEIMTNADIKVTYCISQLNKKVDSSQYVEVHIGKVYAYCA